MFAMVHLVPLPIHDCAVEAGILARSAGHVTQFSRRLARAAAQGGSTSRHSSWSKPVDQPQNSPEQLARHGNLRHLEGDVARVRDDLRADLDELLAQPGQRPVFDRLRQCQCSHEVGEIVGQRMKLKSDGVGGE